MTNPLLYISTLRLPLPRDVNLYEVSLQVVLTIHWRDEIAPTKLTKLNASVGPQSSVGWYHGQRLCTQSRRRCSVNVRPPWGRVGQSLFDSDLSRLLSAVARSRYTEERDCRETSEIFKFKISTSVRLHAVPVKGVVVTLSRIVEKSLVSTESLSEDRVTMSSLSISVPAIIVLSTVTYLAWCLSWWIRSVCSPMYVLVFDPPKSKKRKRRAGRRNNFYSLKWRQNASMSSTVGCILT